jgi:hypothetical protein
MMYGGVDVQIHILLTSILVGGEWPASCPGSFNPGKSPRHPLSRRLGGLQSRSGQRGKEEIFLPYWVSNSDPSVDQPVVSLYTNCTIPAQAAYNNNKADLIGIWWMKWTELIWRPVVFFYYDNKH